MFIYRPCLEGARVLNTCDKSGGIIPLYGCFILLTPGHKNSRVSVGAVYPLIAWFV